MGMRTDRATLASVLALVLAGTASLTLLMLPVYMRVRSSAMVDSNADSQTVVTTVSQTTLWQQNGPGVLLILGAPVLVALAPFMVRRVTRRLLWRLSPAILLTAFCVLTGFSIGLFYVPAAVALWAAAILEAAPGASRLDGL